MWGLPLAFVVGYAVARWFGDNIQAVATYVWAELGKILGEWA